jgi:hypothetical protein
VHTKGYQGNVHKAAQVVTNDPRRRKLVIGLKGTIWAPIIQKPQRVYLTGVVGDKIEGKAYLLAQKPEPLTLELVKVFPPDKIAAELKETEPGRVYELRVTNKTEKEERYAGRIIVKTNYSEKPQLSIPVAANIHGLIEARPKFVTFGKMGKEQLDQMHQQGRAVRRPVMVILKKGNDLQIERCETKNLLFRVISTRALTAGRVFEIQVEARMDKLKEGMNRDVLKIFTNQKDKPVLEVPIRFEIL